MRRQRAWGTSDDGSAALEFITVGVILLVPLVYLIVVLGMIQEHAFGAEAAARHTARAIAMAPDAQAAAARSDTVLAGIIEEYGMNPDDVQASIECLPRGVECPSSGATVIVTIVTRVRLPFVPALFGLDRASVIPVEASATQRVSRMWGG